LKQTQKWYVDFNAIDTCCCWIYFHSIHYSCHMKTLTLWGVSSPVTDWVRGTQFPAEVSQSGRERERERERDVVQCKVTNLLMRFSQHYFSTLAACNIENPFLPQSILPIVSCYLSHKTTLINSALFLAFSLSGSVTMQDFDIVWYNFAFFCIFNPTFLWLLTYITAVYKHSSYNGTKSFSHGFQTLCADSSPACFPCPPYWTWSKIQIPWFNPPQ
jgi:hypothetical protein